VSPILETWLLGVGGTLIISAIGAYFYRLEQHLGLVVRIDKKITRIETVLKYIAGDKYQPDEEEEG